MIVVGIAVDLVDRDVELVGALDEIQRSCNRGIYDPRVVEALLYVEDFETGSLPFVRYTIQMPATGSSEVRLPT